ncbi:hypothetical protein ACFL23_03845 [Patescibacteria group bacterium]
MKAIKLKKTNILQILIGIGSLFIGILVYLIDRSPNSAYFVYNCRVNISLYNIFPNIFGFIGNNLPSFIHVFSFILITGGLISYNNKRYFIISLFWLIINFAFELGQKFNLFSSKIIPCWFEYIPFLENAKNYFLKGTFDIFDLLAIVIGSLLAYILLLCTGKEKFCYEHKRQDK